MAKRRTRKAIDKRVYEALCLHFRNKFVSNENAPSENAQQSSGDSAVLM